MGLDVQSMNGFDIGESSDSSKIVAAWNLVITISR